MRYVTAFALAAGLGAIIAAPPAAHAQKVLSIGMASQDVGQLDPHRAVSTQDKPVVGWVFNGLVRFKPGTADMTALEPDLAESWTASPDKTVWTFKLRRGVQFHRGFGEMTSEDVVFSLQRAASKDASSFASDYAAVESVTAPDAYTVQIKLKNIVPGFLGLVANYQGGNIVSKKAVAQLGDQYRTMPVGTGPFEIKEYQPNQGLTLVANKAYFRGVPKIDQISYKFIPSDASRDLAFTAGEIQIIYGRQDDKWIDRMKKTPGVVLAVMRPAELGLLMLDQTKPPLDNIKVRQAVAYAIDRAQMVKFKGEGSTEAGISVIPAGYLGSVDAKLYPHDIAKAKQLLKEAGFPNGVQLKSIQTSLPSMLNTMQIVQAQLKQAGIDLQLEVVDHPTFHAQIRKDLSQVVQYAAARFPVADIYLTQFYHSRSIPGSPTASTNFGHCKVADAEIDAARVETDSAKQLQLWKTAQEKIAADVCAVPMFEALQVWAYSSKVKLGYELKASLNLGPPITENSTID